MKIWGNSSTDGSPSSSPLAEKAKAKMSKSSSHQRISTSSTSSGCAPELEPLPVVSAPSSTDNCADTCTTSKDDDSKYAVHPELLKQELREGRQAADATSSHHPTNNQHDRTEAEENSEREPPKPSSSHKKQHQPKTDSHQLEEPTTATATSSNKGGNTLSRMLFSSSNKEAGAQQPASRDQVKVIYRQFGPDATEVLTVEHDAGGMPSPNAADHVVVKIQASTVTLDDCLMRRGFDFDVLHPLCLPQTPGFDVVGTVCACGSKASENFEEGDRVAALVRTGGNARFLSVPASSLVKIPRSIDAAEAAAMVSIYTTAYQTLKRITQKGPMFSLLGNKVMIVGGMDAVGQALIQMCHKARAEIYATGPKHRHSYLRNILNVHPLPEDKEEWLPMVRGRMDYVFDGVCEDGLQSSRQALKEKGEVVCYGQSSMLKEREMGIFGAPMMAHINKLWSQQAANAKHVDIWQSFQEDPDTFKKNLKSLCQLLKWNKVKPHISKRVTLTEVAAAQSKLENGEIRGTVVCLPWKKIEVDG